MRIMRGGAFWVAAVGLVMLAGCKSAEQKEADKAEQEKLQGTWRVSSATEGDKGEDDEEGAKAGGAGDVYIIDKDIMTHKVGGQAVEWERITVDASKDPKTIDLLMVNEDGSRFTTKSSSTKGSGKKKKTTTTTTEYRRLGVYKLEGDTLTITLSSTNGKTRPASVNEKRFSTITLKKVKDGKEDAKGEKKDEKDKEDKKDEKKDKEDKKGKEDKKDDKKEEK